MQMLEMGVITKSKRGAFMQTQETPSTAAPFYKRDQAKMMAEEYLEDAGGQKIGFIQSENPDSHSCYAVFDEQGRVIKKYFCK